MAFQNYVCWQKGLVFSVMNPDAEHVRDDVFLAVHSDHELSMMDPNPGNRVGSNTRWRLGTAEFLKRFLDPNKHHVQAVIQGESGSGKSILSNGCLLICLCRRIFMYLSFQKPE
jgi:hypothetical protein